MLKTTSNTKKKNVKKKTTLTSDKNWFWLTWFANVHYECVIKQSNMLLNVWIGGANNRLCMVVARLTLVAISITSQEGPSKLLVLLRILGNLLHDLVDISFVISALWTISLCKVILKKKLSYLIGILKKSRCIWNWRWFEECSFGKVKYDIQIIERWLVEKRSSVN